MEKKKKNVYYFGYKQTGAELYTPNLHVAKRRSIDNVAVQLTKEAK